jgi:flagellar biosynthetic protein FlhB
MAEEGGEKTQEATPHRRQQAREEGNVVLSHDFNSAAMLLVGLLGLMYAGGRLLQYLVHLLAEQLGGAAWLSVDRDLFVHRWSTVLAELAQVVLPVLGVNLIAAIALSLLQTGFLFVPERIAPDISRLDPLAGLRRLFSLSSVVRLFLGIWKVVLISVVAFVAIYKQRLTVLTLTGLEVPQIGAFAWDVCVWTCIKIALVLLLLAILDYAFQWWKNERDLRMSAQEVREEMRNLQGDPQIMARRRAVQRQLAISRLKSAVPKADVVITNPTELAVAVQYDFDTMAAPIVVAKGAGVLAQRIRRLALENGIPIVEKKPLAQALYRDVDLNHPIPTQLYAAVAEVLAYVYQLKGKPMPVVK